MADKKVVDGLKWVKGEIIATLRPIRDLVETIGASASPPEMTGVVPALDQVHGVLLALQLPTPARLVQEMRQLAERMSDTNGEALAQSATVMGQALAQLSTHLDRLDAGLDEPPLSLWSIINEVRAACDNLPLSHSELLAFAAVDTGDSQWVPEALDILAAVMRQVRPQFHRHLVEWYRGGPESPGLRPLIGLFRQLHGHLKEVLLADLFRLAEVFAAALRDGRLDTVLSTRSLMGHLDRVLKPLIQQPPQWPESEILALIEQLLNTLAEGGITSPTVAEIQARYGGSRSGDSAAPGLRSTASGDEALAKLARSALDELGQLKERFDQFAQGGAMDGADRDDFVAVLRRLSEGLEGAASGDLPSRLGALAEEIAAQAPEASADDSTRLESIAAELLGIEALLRSHADLRAMPAEQILAPDMDLSEITSATLREAGYEMARVKEAITGSHADGGTFEVMAAVPDYLISVSGALRMLGEDAAADLSDTIGTLVQGHYLAVGRSPERAEFEHLADAVSALDLYISHLQEPQPFGDSLIERAGQACAALDALLGAPPQPTADIESTHLPDAGPPESETAPETSESVPSGEVETEFLDIFLEEAREETDSARVQFARWESNPYDATALTTLRRSFHTLKGSGRLVGAEQVAEFAQAIEFLLNPLIESQSLPSEDILSCVAEAVATLPDLIAAEAEARPFDIDPIVSRANRLREEETRQAPAAETRGPGVSTESATTEVTPELPDHDSLFIADEELLRIFRAETHEHLAELQSFLQRADSGDARVDESIQRALHTLTGSARMSGIESIARVTKGLELGIKPCVATNAPLDGELLDLFKRAVEGVEERVDELPKTGAGAAALTDLAADLDRLGGLRPEQAEAASPTRGTLPTAEMPPLDSATAPSEAAEHDEEEDQARPEWSAETADAPPELEPGRLEEPEDALPETPTSAPEEAAERAEESAPSIPAPPPTSPTEALPTGAEDQEPQPATTESTPTRETAPAASADTGSAPDPDLVNLFLEDARDLLDNLDTQFREWQLAPQDLNALDGINRLLHTLKGSARLTGLTAIGDLSHALETRLKALCDAPGGVNDTTLELAQRTVDTLSIQVDALEQGAPAPRLNDLIEALGRESEEAPGGPEAEPDVAVMRPSTPEEAPAATGDIPPSMLADLTSAREGASAVAVTPQIRVRSDLLNRLVNHAGEINIYRGRLTQRNGLLGFGLGELDQTVARLRDRIRLMEIETQTQILYRYKDSSTASNYDEKFDPLELDRFSRLQQLSNSLAETVNDLISVKEMLGGYQREFTDLLTQQARLADDLQDGLLRTRLVPFVQVVPRLHRLVRQTADSLGKSARLEVVGPEVELDRTVLDRLVAPLEHLLRNAVDHGLEDPQARAAAEKPATGLVTLALRREGNDAVISLSDDGQGMNLEAIREKAIARGLLAPEASLPEEVLLQFILEPGFTTSGKVTQISGRGVGLDVVASEIKAANGTISLESVPGRGARFTIRLPLTLAIIDAFLVSAGDNIYAVPHSTVEATARIARDDLIATYQGEDKEFKVRGQAYKVVYLGGVLDPRQEPDFGERRWLPVLLVRLGDQRVALQVDSLIESQRILVKPLGPQLVGVRWLSGGTILPDGRVALILDALALLRSGAARDYQPATAAPETTSVSPCVMVVDDSLTVRRVTSRLLRRQDIEVMTAKDGVEALTLLDERTPDLLLLDIEMPRMDGYELTRHIRRSEHLQHLPIIMITSRAGAKHREYALNLGVDRYLGKPYQESELLEEINALLQERSPA